MTDTFGFTPRRRAGWLLPLIIGGAVLLIVALPLVGSYNGLVSKDQAVDAAFADIDTQLQRRNDLIPNLSDAVRSAIGQEQAVFGEIAQARTRYGGATTPDQKVAASNQLDGALSRLLVVIEQYPQLQSNGNIRSLMDELAGTENRIAQARRDYNLTVNDYNTSVRRFPRSLVAGIFGFDKRPLFKATPGSDVPPRVGDLSGRTSPTPTPAR